VAPRFQPLDPGLAPASFAASFHRFRRILDLNNAVIETIAELERALAGEYVFDRKFLRESVDRLNELLREVIFSLNALADNRYLDLYNRYEEIAGRLTILAAGFGGPYDHSLVLPYDLVDGDLNELVGSKNATLGEIRNHLGLAAPNGFAVTRVAYQQFMEGNDLFVQIDAVLAGANGNRERADRIALLFDQARFPEPLVETLARELEALLEHCGGPVDLAVRSSGVGEDDGPRSFAGQFHSVLGVRPEIQAVLAAYRQVVASRFSAAALEYMGKTALSRDLPMAVAVQEMIPARTSGILYSRDPERPDSGLMLISAVRGLAEELVAGRVAADRYTVNRLHPFDLVESAILPEPPSSGPEQNALRILPSGLRRGSAMLLPEMLKRLAETALLLEKTLGGPQDLEWAIGRQLVILQSRPLVLPRLPPPPPAEITSELAAAKPLLQGKGEAAQLGIAAGNVYHVDDDTDPDLFPVGGIAVARFPSPQLSPIVLRAAAIITDVGGPTGHLATIAREYRTPALFGTGEATAVLTEGAEVTVDVENKRIYPGILAGLVRLQAAQASEAEPYLRSAEVQALRRLLRWVAPITLVDPGAADFTPAGCRTFHDILRFSHEKAVDALIHLHASPQGSKGVRSRPLRVAVPIKLRVIDLGSGLSPAAAATTGVVTMDMVQSQPLVALLAGLQKETAWDREPAPLDFKDVLASMSRPLSMLTNAPAYVGENLAIIAERYCNLSLRLGYHFNVVDAYLSQEPDDNYIYFRFVGGFADKTKRARRVKFIAAVLAGLSFKVNSQGDLLVAKAKTLDAGRMVSILTMLGELIAFTRGLDVHMRDEAAVEHHFQKFLHKVRVLPVGDKE